MTDSKIKLPVGINIGVDYYPEHWDESLWVKDADMMHEAGVKIVRMAEFAWSRLEPDEGDFDFEWLDRAVKLFEDRDIYVVLSVVGAVGTAVSTVSACRYIKENWQF